MSIIIGVGLLLYHSCTGRPDPQNNGIANSSHAFFMSNAELGGRGGKNSYNMFFTRLTPNFNDWKKPSGWDGKCKSANPQKPLYEELNGFGWEEWLFEQYHIHKEESEFECKGFVEAFNQKNEDIQKIDRLYLYTKLCDNIEGVIPGYYYVGYINNVSRIKYLSKTNEEVHKTLTNVGIMNDSFVPMLPFALNISFKVKDVHVDFKGVFNRPIRLELGQFRFGLYNLKEHTNFLTTISKYNNH